MMRILQEYWMISITILSCLILSICGLPKPSGHLSIRSSIWRADTKTPGFAYCMVDYYCNIRSNSKSKAPFNLWPYSLKFDLLRADLIYSSIIGEDDSIETRIFPGRDASIENTLQPLQ